MGFKGELYHSLLFWWSTNPAQVAFYFAFIQTYLVFLSFPAITGVIAWMYLDKYSLTYAIATCVWCTVFLEYWKIQEVDLSIRWNVQGIGKVKVNRPQFKYEKIVIDETGQQKHYFPKWKQVTRQLLQIPFILFSAVALGTIIILVFAIEVLISEGYDGPYKNLMVSCHRRSTPGLGSHIARNTSPPACWPLRCRTSAAVLRRLPPFSQSTRTTAPPITTRCP